jgi:hypothetical protein
MNKIKLNNIQIPDKNSVYTNNHKHRIYVGTATNYFKNKKNAVRRLSGLNAQLNNTLLELNNIWINIFIDYRKMAIIYNDYFNRDGSCQNLVIMIEKFFVKVTTPSSMVNRNYFYVFNLRKLDDFLIEFTKLLIDVQLSKKHNTECCSLRSLLYRLEGIGKELENFGNDPEIKKVQDNE